MKASVERTDGGDIVERSHTVLKLPTGPPLG